MAVVIALVAVAALATGAGLAVALGSRNLVGQEPDPTSTLEPTAAVAATASPEPTPEVTPSTTPVPSSTDVPSPTMTASPSPVTTPPPTPEPVVGVQWPLDIVAATVTHDLGLRSAPEISPSSTIYAPRLPKGTRMELRSGPVAGSGYWWYRVRLRGMELDGGVVSGWIAAANKEGTEPFIAPAEKTCGDLPFPDGPDTATSADELFVGMHGTWAGCVTTPWDDPYPVRVTFRDDNTYSGRRLLGGGSLPNGNSAFRNGSDKDSPLKIYTIDGFASGGGFGSLSIVFDAGNPAPGSLRNVRLMDDQLSFDHYYKHQYGPIQFRLYRLTPTL
jgi:hypothetical protein